MARKIVDLPQAIAPWSIYLRLFNPTASALLAKMVHRIDRAMEKLDAAVVDDGGELEGYDGIDNRGDYQRLLLSEWLIAEELPDEFMRRASTGEHTFLRIAKTAPIERRNTILLFDSGPTQLGASRLVHLALLVVLARRSDVARSTLSWGVLQKPAARFKDVTESNIVELLRSRCLENIQQEHLAGWRKELTQEAVKSDVWTVSAESQKLLAEDNNAVTVSNIVVKETFSSSGKTIHLIIQRCNARPVEIDLKMPDPESAARVLRNPFNSQHAPLQLVKKTKLAIPSNLKFSADGHHFFMRQSDHTVAVYRTIHKVAKEEFQFIKPKLYTSYLRRRILAVGMGVFKTTIALLSVVDSEMLQLELIGGSHQGKVWTVRLPFKCDEKNLKTDEISICAESSWNPMKVVAVVDKHLIEIDISISNTHIPATVVANNVSQIRIKNNKIIFDMQSETLISLTKGRPPVKLEFPNSNKIIIGFGSKFSNGDFGLVGVQNADDCWSVHNAIEKFNYPKLPTGEVVGAVGAWSKKSPGLILIDEKRKISIEGTDWSINMPTLVDEIISVDVNQYGTIVYLSKTGELVVFSPEHGLLYRHRLVAD